MATKGYVQLASNYTYFSDSWFSGVTTAEEALAKGVNYYGPVKNIEKGFCLDTLEKLMKYQPVGSYLVMKSTPKFPDGRPLMAIGYKHNSRKVLSFIATKGEVSNEPHDPYLSLYLPFVSFECCGKEGW